MGKDYIYDDSIVEEALYGLITGEWDRENCAFGDGAAVRTFAEAAIWTGERGLIITMPDGSEYRVTIVQSR